MYIKPDKNWEKGPVIVPHLNTMNALTLLSSNYQRTVESVNFSMTALMAKVGSIELGREVRTEKRGDVKIYHCQVF